MVFADIVCFCEHDLTQNYAEDALTLSATQIWNKVVIKHDYSIYYINWVFILKLKGLFPFFDTNFHQNPPKFIIDIFFTILL